MIASIFNLRAPHPRLASKTSGEGLNYISNAGDARIKGVELELRASLLRN